MIIGNCNRDCAKITGITPDVFTLKGMLEVCPPTIFLPTVLLAYCTGILRTAPFKRITNTTIAIITAKIITAARTAVAGAFPNTNCSNSLPKSSGMLERMLIISPTMTAATKTADYFLGHCKKTDYLPLVDFLAPETPVYYDSTAGVCAACGMLEIAKYVSKEEGRRYAQGAINILKACDAHFCNYKEDQDALVLMGSERYPSIEEWHEGVHIPIIYGDFFFVEALFKLKGNDFLIW